MLGIDIDRRNPKVHAQLAKRLGMGAVRYDWTYGTGETAQPIHSYENAKYFASLGLKAFYVVPIWMSNAPNPMRPLQQDFPAMALHNSAHIEQIVRAYKEAGRDPLREVVFVLGAEVGKGGVNGRDLLPVYRNGVVDPEVKTWLNFSALNTNWQGCEVYTPGLECENPVDAQGSFREDGPCAMELRTLFCHDLEPMHSVCSGICYHLYPSGLDPASLVKNAVARYDAINARLDKVPFGNKKRIIGESGVSPERIRGTDYSVLPPFMAALAGWWKSLSQDILTYQMQDTKATLDNKQYGLYDDSGAKRLTADALFVSLVGAPKMPDSLSEVSI